MTSAIRIEVAPGELIDRLTILEIKRERIADALKRAQIEAEFTMLLRAEDEAVSPSGALLALRARLRSVNEQLWDIEDDIRDCERRAEFGSAFVALARAVYRTNDRRSELKRQINELLGSALIEAKCYRPY